jgi:hypothetical protein
LIWLGSQRRKAARLVDIQQAAAAALLAQQAVAVPMKAGGAKAVSIADPAAKGAVGVAGILHHRGGAVGALDAAATHQLVLAVPVQF